MPSVDPAPDQPADEFLVVTDRLRIPLSELDWRYTASGGPGGQHANTANTRATVTFDIEGSPSLDDDQRARLVAAFGVEVSVSASDERSQLRNRTLAQTRLAERLRGALVIQRSRRATRPSKAAARRRLDAKSMRSATKAGRRRPTED